MSDPSDEELLLAWRGGDREAGDALVSRHFRALYRVFRPRLGAVAPDLIQKTFLASLEAKERIPDGVGFRPYLLGIARKQLLMHLRREGRSPLQPAASRSVAGEDPSPSSVAALREEQRLLLRALRTLNTDTQLTLELFYWERLSRSEIAVVLDVSEATVKSRLERGRTQLRERIQKLAPGTTGETTAADLDGWAESLRERLDEVIDST